MAAISSRQLKNISMLSGFGYRKYKKFVQAAIDLGRAIPKRQLHLVYGEGDRELSKFVSEVAFVRGSQVLGKGMQVEGAEPRRKTKERS
ncbi:hypothetical protein WN944_029637 [Citrus x changshan-huyou]|uniref:Uncharacterized protein n=1 Tax=Citrus x changshan-huyou TaxID=2935761 RepID=A0AAP0LG15_9ROSI